VTAALEPRSNEKPVVALVTPNKPTVVLSQPGAPKPGTGALVVETVEIEPGGKFHVSGQARPGAALRLYLNDSFITSVTAAPDGRVAVTINEGVAAGNYRVRVDEASASGTVRARAEVPFSAPETTASLSAPSTASRRPDPAATQQPQLAAAGATVLPDTGAPPSAVVVPKITTTTVSRGDSLWRLSQSSYGAGTRYAVIYKANKGQIRNPNLIYPGQVFVLPAQ
jgi:nucleoid-associated protein YgaU